MHTMGRYGMAALKQRTISFPALMDLVVLGARLIAGALKTLLHHVKSTDPAVSAAIAFRFLFLALLASDLPARLAGRATVLRES